jgi:hypothetical protein
MARDDEPLDLLEGVSPAYLQSLHARFAADPRSVSPEWQSWLEGMERTVAGPSWARSNWPLNDTDPVTAGLDPTQSIIEKPAAAAPVSVAPPPAPSAAGAVDQDAIVQAAQDTVRAMMLIRTYRVRGHLAADLDPLGLHERELPEDLTPEFHGLDPKSSRPIFLGGALGFETATVAEIVESCAPIIAAMSASNTCTSTTWPSAASCRSGWRARARASPSRRGQAGDPGQGDPGRAVGEVPRPQICRHQALRPRRRRVDGPGARGGHQIWRPARRPPDRHRHGASRPPQRAQQRHGKPYRADLLRICRRLGQS